MSKLNQQEEKELISFIKDWLKAHGYTQKDLAIELNIKSSRTSEISKKVKCYLVTEIFIHKYLYLFGSQQSR